MNQREQLIEDIRRAIDPSQEGYSRNAFNTAAATIRALPLGYFLDEAKDVKHDNGEPKWRLTLLDDKGNRSIFDDIDE